MTTAKTRIWTASEAANAYVMRYTANDKTDPIIRKRLAALEYPTAQMVDAIMGYKAVDLRTCSICHQEAGHLVEYIGDQYEYLCIACLRGAMTALEDHLDNH